MKKQSETAYRIDYVLYLVPNIQCHQPHNEQFMIVAVAQCDGNARHTLTIKFRISLKTVLCIVFRRSKTKRTLWNPHGTKIPFHWSDGGIKWSDDLFKIDFEFVCFKSHSRKYHFVDLKAAQRSASSSQTENNWEMTNICFYNILLTRCLRNNYKTFVSCINVSSQRTETKRILSFNTHIQNVIIASILPFRQYRPNQKTKKRRKIKMSSLVLLTISLLEACREFLFLKSCRSESVTNCMHKMSWQSWPGKSRRRNNKQQKKTKR